MNTRKNMRACQTFGNRPSELEAFYVNVFEPDDARVRRDGPVCCWGKENLFRHTRCTPALHKTSRWPTVDRRIALNTSVSTSTESINTCTFIHERRYPTLLIAKQARLDTYIRIMRS